MTHDADSKPKPDDHRAKEQARLAQALRDNLRRRKVQAKARAAVESEDRAGKPHDSAGIGDDKQAG
jgi:hypothetical protein